MADVKEFEQMTLDEMLEKIDKESKKRAESINKAKGLPINTPVDPADLTICEGCS